eukprot:CAMPEP_0169312456 /NCGR_PEP_ID=MMETSP1017-20121227/4047_1 /TAXON_ID=342587 /ORGANISM="Karlodinium micrum, Strain CCMP2283" /LENGTH=84 /DNA_ID=CAMNT_0009406235 /DNA_START=433 /DNA_END=687 /DNA_ORIENTATION=-
MRLTAVTEEERIIATRRRQALMAGGIRGTMQRISGSLCFHLRRLSSKDMIATTAHLRSSDLNQEVFTLISRTPVRTQVTLEHLV